MPPSGPIYPGANTSKWHGDAYPGRHIKPNRVVLHTTEGHGLPGYRNGANHPHFTAVPDMAAKRLRWYQHQSLYRSARALQNLSGGVETNAQHAIQVELQGTSGWASPKNPRRPYTVTPDWSEAPEWMLRDLGQWLRWLNRTLGIPLIAPYQFGPWQGSTRMTGSQWIAFRGLCGHSHVPENDHTDPGAIDIGTAIRYAATRTPTQEEEEPMKTVTAGYSPVQVIPGDGKEHELGVTKDGIWNFHATAGPFIAQVNGWLQSESTNAQVVIVADTDKTGGRRWVGRETLTPAAPAFQVVGVGSLGAGECLRVLVINHDSAREVQVGNLSVSVIYQEG